MPSSGKLRVCGDSPACERLDTDQQIEELLADRHVATERTLTRLRERAPAGRGERRARWQQRQAPPRIPAVEMPDPGVVFQEPVGYGPPEDVRFYVRTPTRTDVAKLHGAAGTPEWDIGLVAVREAEDFWGWEDHYEPAGQTDRLQWRSAGVIQSAVTQGFGDPSKSFCGRRDERAGHAAEHRLESSQPRP